MDSLRFPAANCASGWCSARRWPRPRVAVEEELDPVAVATAASEILSDDNDLTPTLLRGRRRAGQEAMKAQAEAAAAAGGMPPPSRRRARPRRRGGWRRRGRFRGRRGLTFAVRAWLVVGLGNPAPVTQRPGTTSDSGWSTCSRSDVGWLRPSSPGQRGNRGGAAGGVRARAGQAPDLHEPLRRTGGSTVPFYKTPVSQVVLVHDDLDLPLAVCGPKAGGATVDITAEISSRQFEHRRLPPVRAGIGRPPVGWIQRGLCRSPSR